MKVTKVIVLQENYPTGKNLYYSIIKILNKDSRLIINLEVYYDQTNFNLILWIFFFSILIRQNQLCSMTSNPFFARSGNTITCNFVQTVSGWRLTQMYNILQIISTYEDLKDNRVRILNRRLERFVSKQGKLEKKF